MGLFELKAGIKQIKACIAFLGLLYINENVVFE